MNIVIDLIIICLFTVFIISGYKKGAVKTVLEFFRHIAAIILAYIFTPALSGLLSRLFIQGSIENFIRMKICEFSGEKSITGSDVFALIDSGRPDFAAFLEKIGVDMTGFPGKDATIDEITRYIATPVANTVSKVMAFVIIFVVALIAFKVIISLLDNVMKLPVLNTVNRIGGAVIGVVVGLIAVYVFCFIVSAIAPYFFSSTFNGDEFQNNTIIYRLIIENKPILFLKGLFLK